MSHQRRVYVVDSDLDTRRSLTAQLSMIGAETWPFPTADEFLAIAEHLVPACLLLEVDGPDPGPQVMEELVRRGLDWPVIAISSGQDLKVAVEAMKLGAVDFMRKPIASETLAAALAPAWASLNRKLEVNEARRSAQERVSRLTAREFDIWLTLMAGHPNKAVAYEFGISVRTVEMHRANIMAKLGVKSLAEATLLATQAGVDLAAAALAHPHRAPALVVAGGGSVSDSGLMRRFAP